jgi:hypothetical protein
MPLFRTEEAVSCGDGMELEMQVGAREFIAGHNLAMEPEQEPVAAAGRTSGARTVIMYHFHLCGTTRTSALC